MNTPVDLILPLFPWLIYFVGKFTGQPAWGLVGAATWMIAVRFLVNYSFKSTDWTQFAFFTLLLMGTCWFHSPKLKYQALLAPACYMVLAYGSILVGRPFTSEYACSQVPPEFWMDPLFPRHFYRVNLILTLGWALAFSIAFLCAWVEISYTSLNMSGIIAVPWLGYVLILLLTRYFPHWYQEQIYAKQTPT